MHCFPTMAELATHEKIVQDAFADGYTRDNGFGVHASAKAIMEQLDEFCVEEVRDRGSSRAAAPAPCATGFPPYMLMG
jgi:hypothetical protein